MLMSGEDQNRFRAKAQRQEQDYSIKVVELSDAVRGKELHLSTEMIERIGRTRRHAEQMGAIAITDADALPVFGQHLGYDIMDNVTGRISAQEVRIEAYYEPPSMNENYACMRFTAYLLTSGDDLVPKLEPCTMAFDPSLGLRETKRFPIRWAAEQVINGVSRSMKGYILVDGLDFDPEDEEDEAEATSYAFTFVKVPESASQEPARPSRP